MPCPRCGTPGTYYPDCPYCGDHPKNDDGAICATCSKSLHNPSNFPEDFPVKYKLCCDCLNDLHYLAKNPHYLKNYDNFIELYFVHLDALTKNVNMSEFALEKPTPEDVKDILYEYKYEEGELIKVPSTRYRPAKLEVLQMNYYIALANYLLDRGITGVDPPKRSTRISKKKFKNFIFRP